MEEDVDEVRGTTVGEGETPWREEDIFIPPLWPEDVVPDLDIFTFVPEEAVAVLPKITTKRCFNYTLNNIQEKKYHGISSWGERNRKGTREEESEEERVHPFPPWVSAGIECILVSIVPNMKHRNRMN